MLGCLKDRKWEWKSGPPRGTGVGSVGCPWTAHLLCFGTVKPVPGLCKMGHKKSMCIGMKLCELNGLSWCCVEINRLMLNEG